MSVIDELANHYMTFDRPHIYKCKCGFVQSIFIGELDIEYRILEHAKNVEYLPCGHADCAKLDNGECIICRNTGCWL